MKSYKLLILFFASITFGISCIQPKRDKTTITVSIMPQKYFADRIVGNKLEVMCMVPSGSNPEAYDPSPNQLVQLTKSKAYLAIGNLGFELAWLDKLKQNHPEIQFMNTSTGIQLIAEENKHGKKIEVIHDHVGQDPHVWSSPKSARILAQNIYKSILAIDSTHQKYYEKNLNALLSEIDSLDRQINSKLKPIKNRSFLIYHPALTYLARDYGLNQFSVEYNGKEPTPQHIKTLINLARKENIKVIFIQKEFDMKNASILSKETGCRVIQIDPLNYKWADGLIEIVDALAK